MNQFISRVDMLKTLFLTGARVSEFVALKVKDFYFEERMILIQKGKGEKAVMCRFCPNSRKN